MASAICLWPMWCRRQPEEIINSLFQMVLGALTVKLVFMLFMINLVWHHFQESFKSSHLRLAFCAFDQVYFFLSVFLLSLFFYVLLSFNIFLNFHSFNTFLLFFQYVYNFLLVFLNFLQFSISPAIEKVQIVLILLTFLLFFIYFLSFLFKISMSIFF